jgi:hypothetical protein
MIEKYPVNLIVEDAWGAIPLLYAIWGEAPIDVVQFLINSYQSLYPNKNLIGATGDNIGSSQCFQMCNSDSD